MRPCPLPVQGAGHPLPAAWHLLHLHRVPILPHARPVQLQCLACVLRRAPLHSAAALPCHTPILSGYIYQYICLRAFMPFYLIIQNEKCPPTPQLIFRLGSASSCSSFSPSCASLAHPLSKQASPRRQRSPRRTRRTPLSKRTRANPARNEPAKKTNNIAQHCKTLLKSSEATF